jgi:hypothetical protein
MVTYNSGLERQMTAAYETFANCSEMTEEQTNHYIDSQDKEWDYGMFSPGGDFLASQIVQIAIDGRLSFETVLALMKEIATSRPDEFGEIMDTTVREAIFQEAGYFG